MLDRRRNSRRSPRWCSSIGWGTAAARPPQRLPRRPRHRHRGGNIASITSAQLVRRRRQGRGRRRQGRRPRRWRGRRRWCRPRRWRALGYGSLSNVVINYRGVQQLKWLSNSPIHGAPNGRWQLQWLGCGRAAHGRRGGSESGGDWSFAAGKATMKYPAAPKQPFCLYHVIG